MAARACIMRGNAKYEKPSKEALFAESVPLSRKKSLARAIEMPNREPAYIKRHSENPHPYHLPAAEEMREISGEPQHQYQCLDRKALLRGHLSGHAQASSRALLSHFSPIIISARPTIISMRPAGARRRA